MWNIINPSSDFLVTLSFTIVLFAISLHYYLRQTGGGGGNKAHSRPPPLPPGPRGVPLLGYLPFLGRDLHRQFADLASLHGPIFKFWLGNKLCIVLTSPALVRELAREKDVVFANHELSIAGAISTRGGKDIAFTPHGPTWKKLRQVFVRQTMSNAALDRLRGLRSEEVGKSVRRIHCSAGEELDVGQLAFTASADSLLRMLWGGSVDGEEARAAVADTGEFRRAAWEILFLVGKPNVSDVFPALARLDFQGIARETRRLAAVFERMFDSAIERRRRVLDIDGGGLIKMARNNDFLQFLLEFVDDEKGEDSETSITMDQLKATLMDPVVGGTQSTSTTVEWAMAELLKNREKLRKVQEELSQVVGLTNMVKESHLSKLPYLQAVVKETLRLHPPFPLLVPRYPTRPATLGGFRVPERATIFINAWAIHRNPSAWEDPLEFKPERFVVDDPDKFDYNNFNYIPFGSGRRMCPGIPLTERMVPLVLASFLHCFHWKLTTGDGGDELDLSDKFGLVTSKLKPLVAIPTPRLSDLDLYYA